MLRRGKKQSVNFWQKTRCAGLAHHIENEFKIYSSFSKPFPAAFSPGCVVSTKR
jgi:hypothetical protein